MLIKMLFKKLKHKRVRHYKSRKERCNTALELTSAPLFYIRSRSIFPTISLNSGKSSMYST